MVVIVKMKRQWSLHLHIDVLSSIAIVAVKYIFGEVHFILLARRSCDELQYIYIYIYICPAARTISCRKARPLDHKLNRTLHFAKGVRSAGVRIYQALRYIVGDWFRNMFAQTITSTSSWLLRPRIHRSIRSLRQLFLLRLNIKRFVSLVG